MTEYYTLTVMDKKKKTDKFQVPLRMQNNQNRPSHIAGRNGRNAKMVEPLGKLIVPVTLNAHLSDDSAILLLGIYPGK